jgi:hypothetical protein
MPKPLVMTPDEMIKSAGEIIVELPHLSGQMSVGINQMEESVSICFDNIHLMYGGPAFRRERSGRYVLIEPDCYAPVQLRAHRGLWEKLRKEECRLSCETLDAIRDGNKEYEEILDSSSNRGMNRARIKLTWVATYLMEERILMTFGASLREEILDVEADMHSYSQAQDYVKIGMQFFVDFMKEADGSLPADTRSTLENCIDMGERINTTYVDLIGNCQKMLREYERTKRLLM